MARITGMESVDCHQDHWLMMIERSCEVEWLVFHGTWNINVPVER
jgi:hypothetical protein